ncbi:MAG TPA: FeoA family protein [Steroidobacteraceae bacterium]|nr:FeoA family protein [Steroidobacteraceae bacterium]
MKTASFTAGVDPDRQIPLAQLKRGQTGVVTGLVEATTFASGRGSDSLLARLRDLGFVPGARCEIVARMWLGGDPLAVRIGGSTFALRRIEAAAVRVELSAEPDAERDVPREGSSAVAA